jgi:hypothetical protein
LPRALERVGGIQAQYAPSSYIGLWSRLEGFERTQLNRALERRTVVQATLMRSTIHLVSGRDYRPLADGIRPSRRDWWLRVHGRPLAGVDVDAAAAELRRALAGRTVGRDELVELTRRHDPHGGTTLFNGIGAWLDLVRVPPSGTWERRRADLFATADDWLGPGGGSEQDGLELLLRRYLGAFGPARLADAADWAGVGVTTLRPAAERLRLRTFHDEAGKELLDLPRAPVPDPETPAPVRFLPTWDATLLVHARRTGILPERHRTRIFNTKTPHSFPTFLVDGAVAGTWRYEHGRVTPAPFERLPRAVRKELEDEAERLAALLL